MKSVIFKRYNGLAAAHVEFSTLMAGGFHPSFHNQHHAVMNSLALMALGGLLIMVPEQEYEEAHDFLANMKKAALAEQTIEWDIRERRFGKWKSGTLFSLTSGFFLPYFLIPARSQFVGYGLLIAVLTILWSTDQQYSFMSALGYSLLLLSFPLFISTIIMHAEYCAVPKLCERSGS